MTALDHCINRLTSCTDRKIVAELILFLFFVFLFCTRFEDDSKCFLLRMFYVDGSLRERGKEEEREREGEREGERRIDVDGNKKR